MSTEPDAAQLGHGSTFSFSFVAKLDTQTPNAAESFVAPSNDALKRTKVLVVDDVETNGIVIKQMLRVLGVGQVTWVNDGRYALAAIKENNFDLVLMDLHMPDMDGLETTTVLRADTTYDSLPIIALTAATAEEDRTACKNVGMNGFLSKPVKMDDLKLILRNWIKPPTLTA